MRLSEECSIIVHVRKKRMDVVHNLDGKMHIATLSGTKFKQLKNLLAVAGLPPAAIKAQLAIKKMVLNNQSWLPDEKMMNEDPQKAKLLIQMHRELVAAHNELADFNTKKQKENLKAIRDMGGN